MGRQWSDFCGLSFFCELVVKIAVTAAADMAVVPISMAWLFDDSPSDSDDAPDDIEQVRCTLLPR